MVTHIYCDLYLLYLYICLLDLHISALFLVSKISIHTCWRQQFNPLKPTRILCSRKNTIVPNGKYNYQLGFGDVIYQLVILSRHRWNICWAIADLRWMFRNCQTWHCVLWWVAAKPLLPVTEGRLLEVWSPDHYGHIAHSTTFCFPHWHVSLYLYIQSSIINFH